MKRYWLLSTLLSFNCDGTICSFCTFLMIILCCLITTGILSNLNSILISCDVPLFVQVLKTKWNRIVKVGVHSCTNYTEELLKTSQSALIWVYETVCEEVNLRLVHGFASYILKVTEMHPNKHIKSWTIWFPESKTPQISEITFSNLDLWNSYQTNGNA